MIGWGHMPPPHPNEYVVFSTIKYVLSDNSYDTILDAVLDSLLTPISTFTHEVYQQLCLKYF